MPSLGTQVALLFVLALPIACVAWTVTHEEVFREPREYCVRRSRKDRSIVSRKFFYLFTCEYCFSHYVTIAVLLMTGYQLVFPDWRGYVIGGFSLVWIANPTRKIGTPCVLVSSQTARLPTSRTTRRRANGLALRSVRSHR